MDKYEKQLQAIDREIREALGKARAITARAHDEGRGLTDEERPELDAAMKSVDVLKEKRGEIEEAIETRTRIEDAGKAIIVEEPRTKAEDAGDHRRATSLGEAFVKSDGYKALVESGGPRGKWSTGAVELEGKALLDSGAVGDNYNGAGGLLNADVQPGILGILSQRLTVADLMAAGTTGSGLVRYMVEKTATSGAAGVPESGEKPESELEFDAVDEPVKKIATFLPVTDEMIEDVPQLTSYINGRLALFVRQEEEAQLLDGGGGDDLEGLMSRIPVGNQGINAGGMTEASNAADHIFAAMTKVRESYLEPDAIVIHPNDWAAIALLKDGNDRYIAGGPFSAQPDTLWGKRVVVTAAVDEGTAVVGAFATAAQIFRRGGLSVEASNSHADFFKKNKTAIRAEERLALAVYRPEAFATADLTIVS